LNKKIPKSREERNLSFPLFSMYSSKMNKTYKDKSVNRSAMDALRY
jgi:hypothetical protein